MTSMTDASVPPDRPVAFFDFDDTISIGDTMLHWQRWYLHKRHSHWMLPWIWTGCLLKTLGASRLWFKRFYMASSNRESDASRENLVREFQRELLSQVIHPELVERAWLHHQLGDRLCIVSASPEFLLRDLGEVLPPHTLVATRLVFEGRHLWNLPLLDGSDVKAEGKLAALQEAHQLPAPPDSFAYSDSHTDIPLLKSVDFPVAVRPTPLLAQTVHSLGWQRLEPIAPWPFEKDQKTKAKWLLFPFGLSWPPRHLPERGLRKRHWRAWKKSLVRLHRAVHDQNSTAFELHHRDFERVASQLKGVALRMALALVQKPLSRQGMESTYLDRVWGGGLQQALRSPEIDTLRHMIVGLPGFDAAVAQTAPIRCIATAQFYRAHRPGQEDGILKLFLPGIRTLIQSDLEQLGKLPKSLPEEAQRAWKGLERELSQNMLSEVDPDREEAVSRRLAPLFADAALGIRMPWARAVRQNDMEGVFYEAAEGYPLPIYFAYLRETRHLRDPRARAEPDFQGFAAFVARSGELPQGRMLSQRLWTLLSYSFWHAGIWLPIGGNANVSVIPGLGDTWRLGIRDLAGSLDFSEGLRNSLAHWDDLAEGDKELRSLCLEMGWTESALTLHTGRLRDLVELVWHPFLHGCEATGFAFESWRLDGRLQSLIGPGHAHEEWPIPDRLRPIFRTLYWLRRNLAGVLEN